MIYIFGDVHLRKEAQDSEKSFLNLFARLARSPNTEKIFFLGDIFDVCVGSHRDWSQVYPGFFDILSRTIPPIYYFAGNHDFFIHRLLRQTAPANKIFYFEKEANLRIGNKSVYFAHGDRIFKKSRRFCRIKRFLYWIAEPLPLTIVYPLAIRLSNYLDELAVDNAQKTAFQWPQFAHFIQSKWHQGSTGVILGHTHIPEQRWETNGRFYLNCGFWPLHRSYFSIQPQNWLVKRCIETTNTQKTNTLY